jgi:hypothetical protein
VESLGTGLGPIKGMIRHRQTGEYYKGNGLWTSDTGQAMQFENLSKVVSEAQKFGLEDCCELSWNYTGKYRSGFACRYNSRVWYLAVEFPTSQ